MIEIDSGKCSNCADCYDVCPAYVFGIRGRNGKKDVFVVHPGQCIVCGHRMAARAPLAISHLRLSHENFERLGEVDFSPASMKNFLLSRRSVRRFREEPVPEDLIDDLIEVATHAGTGGNLQSVGLTIVMDKDLPGRACYGCCRHEAQEEKRAPPTGKLEESPRRVDDRLSPAQVRYEDSRDQQESE